MHLLNKNAAVTVKQKPMGEDNITLPRKSVKIPATKNKTYHRTEEKQPDLKTYAQGSERQKSQEKLRKHRSLPRVDFVLRSRCFERAVGLAPLPLLLELEGFQVVGLGPVVQGSPKVVETVVEVLQP